jgi:hypothetical protein
VAEARKRRGHTKSVMRFPASPTGGLPTPSGDPPRPGRVTPREILGGPRHRMDRGPASPRSLIHRGRGGGLPAPQPTPTRCMTQLGGLGLPTPAKSSSMSHHVMRGVTLCMHGVPVTKKQGLTVYLDAIHLRLIDDLMTFYGNTRPEVVRNIVIEWLKSNRGWGEIRKRRGVK